jgi:glycosyltransferase 2 family protein
MTSGRATLADQAATPQRWTPHRARRRLVLGLGLGLPVSGLLLWAATRGLDLGEVWVALRGVQPWAMAGAVALMGMVYAVQAERWRLLSRHLGAAPRSTFFALVLGGVALNNIIPGRPGEVLRGYWLARRLRVSVARAVATVVVDRVADAVALAALLVLTVPFVDHPSWLVGLLIATAALSALACTGLLAAWWYTNRSVRGRARGGLDVKRSRLGRQASEFVRGSAAMIRPSVLGTAAVFSVAAWLVWALGAWVVARGIGIDLDVFQTIFITGVINLGVAVPSSPGFVGTYQWLAVAALGVFGVAQPDAFAFAILLQAAWFIPTTLAGAGLAVATGTGWYKVAPVPAEESA